MGDDEWTVVAKGSRRKMSSTKLRALQAGAETSLGKVEDPPDVSVDKTWSQIDRAVGEIKEAQFCKTLLKQLRDAGFRGVEEGDAKTKDSSPKTDDVVEDSSIIINTFKRMVILGLGSPTNSPVSRFQLALAIILSGSLGVRRENVELYDPVFTPNDVATLEKNIGKIVNRQDADKLCGPSALRQKVPTFWFMPHCEAVLYNNVLRANRWDAEGGDAGDTEVDVDTAVEKTKNTNEKTETERRNEITHAFLGNKFETYDLRWVGRRAEPECPSFVLESAGLIAESGLEIGVDPAGSFAPAAALGAFNDTSVQVVLGGRGNK